MKNYILLVITSFILFSCKARKSVELPVNANSVINNNKAFLETISKKHNFESVKINSTIDAQLDRSVPLIDATFYIENNQKIWINLQTFFINVARGLATPTQVKAYEKINKTYIETDFTYLNNMLNINFMDYNAMQNLLLGKTFVPVSETNYTITKNAQGYILTTIKPEKVTINNKVSEYDITLNYSPEFFLTHVNVQKTNNTENLKVLYENYQNFEGKNFPKNVKIIIKGSKNGQILIENTKFEFLKMETPFSIPSNYTKNKIK